MIKYLHNIDWSQFFVDCVSVGLIGFFCFLMISLVVLMIANATTNGLIVFGIFASIVIVTGCIGRFVFGFRIDS